jgi:hypothetical protein
VDRKSLLWALTSTFFGVLFHPTFLLFPGSLVLLSLCILILKPLRKEKNHVKAAKSIAIVSGIVAVMVLPYAIYVNVSWFDRSRSLFGGWGYGFIMLALQLVKYYSIPLCFTAAFGAFCILRKDLFTGCYYGFSIVIPVLILLIMSLIVDVRPDYIMCVYPLLFLASGQFITHIKENTQKGLFFSLSLMAMLIAFMLPEFISNYTGKRSLDVRKVVEYVQDSYQEGDKILSFLIEFNFYLEEDYDIEPYLGATYQSNWKARLKKYENDPSRVWILFKEGRDAVSPELKEWLQEHAQLKLEVIEKRYDYTYRVFRVYLKEPRH